MSSPASSSASSDLLPGWTLFMCPVCPFANRCTIALLEYGEPLTSLVSMYNVGIYEDMAQWYINNVNREETVPCLLEHSSAMARSKFAYQLKSGDDAQPQALIRRNSCRRSSSGALEKEAQEEEDKFRSAEHNTDGKILLESMDINKGFDEIVFGSARDSSLFGSVPPSRSVYPAEHREAIDAFVAFVSDNLIGELYDFLRSDRHHMKETGRTVAAAMKKVERAFAEGPGGAGPAAGPHHHHHPQQQQQKTETGQQEQEEESTETIYAALDDQDENEDAKVPRPEHQHRHHHHHRIGPFFCGTQFTNADIVLVPFLDRFRFLLEKYCRGFRLLNQEETPLLCAMFEAASKRLSFRATALPREYYQRCYLSLDNGSYIADDNPVASELRRAMKAREQAGEEKCAEAAEYAGAVFCV